jgi:hypothetical protein
VPEQTSYCEVRKPDWGLQCSQTLCHASLGRQPLSEKLPEYGATPFCIEERQSNGPITLCQSFFAYFAEKIVIISKIMRYE